MTGWGRALDGEPKPGVHYPENELQFCRWINSEEDAREYLEAVRFRGGAFCPRCNAKNPRRRHETETKPAEWWCHECRRRVSLTTQTAMERSHIPLEVWLRAAWHMTNSKAGVSALTLSNSFGVSYRHTLYLTHKIRAAMVHSTEKLSDEVEIDETFVGGYEENGQGAQRANSNKATVLVATERVRYEVKTKTASPPMGQ